MSSILLYDISPTKRETSSYHVYILIKCSFLVSSIYLAGFPPKMVLSGIKVFGGTTVLLAMIEFSPIILPSQITELFPIITPSLIILEIIQVPLYIVTLSPIFTFATSIYPGIQFSVIIDTLSSILHCSPITTEFISPLITV